MTSMPTQRPLPLPLIAATTPALLLLSKEGRDARLLLAAARTPTLAPAAPAAPALPSAAAAAAALAAALATAAAGACAALGQPLEHCNVPQNAPLLFNVYPC